VSKVLWHLVTSGRGRVQEWVVTEVKDRTSALDSLIAGETPVVSRIDCGPEKFGYETIECDTGVAEHFQLTKFAVLSTVLELQADLMLTLRVLRQFESNSRSIVRNTRNVRVIQSGVRDIEQTNEGLVIDLLNRHLDFVRRLSHVAQGPYNLWEESTNGNLANSIYCAISEDRSLDPISIMASLFEERGR